MTDFSLKKWRLIPPMEAEGSLQMSIDEWLLTQHKDHGHPPTLRFYTWNPPAISLGVSQKKYFPPHWHNLTYQGKPLDIVKRPTGGRAVLHQGDLTYSVITSMTGSREDTYKQICQFLIQGWSKLGIDLHFGHPDRSYLQSANCFALATNADLVDRHGNKFIGSSQLKKGKFILQHGSMQLQPDLSLFQEVFQALPPKSLISENLSLETIVSTLTQSASECFKCEFSIEPLSPQELAHIKTWKDTK